MKSIYKNIGYLCFAKLFAGEKPMKFISAHHLSPLDFDGV